VARDERTGLQQFREGRRLDAELGTRPRGCDKCRGEQCNDNHQFVRLSAMRVRFVLSCMMATQTTYAITWDLRQWSVQQHYSSCQKKKKKSTPSFLIALAIKINNLQTEFSVSFNQQAFQTYTVAGHSAGLFKNAGTFSYIRVFAAGHEVAAYNNTGLATGQAASQFFAQAMAGQPLAST